jgi:hypothetical protein
MMPELTGIILGVVMEMIMLTALGPAQVIDEEQYNRPINGLLSKYERARLECLVSVLDKNNTFSGENGKDTVSLILEAGNILNEKLSIIRAVLSKAECSELPVKSSVKLPVESPVEKDDYIW